MQMSNMPTHDSVRDFSLSLSRKMGYDLSMEKEVSRVVLLTRDKKPKRFDET